MYNTHSIRKQVSREWYLPAGKPNFMYNYPADSVRNYAASPDSSLLELIEDQLSWFDETAYLDPATRALCDTIIVQANISYDPSILRPRLDQPHTQAYIALREGLFQAEQSGTFVTELEPPIGALATIKEIVEKERFRLAGGDLELKVSLGEREVDNISNDKAQINPKDDDNGVFFEP